MKRVLITLGITFWVVVLLAAACILLFTTTNINAPRWLSWLPGVEGGNSVFRLGGSVIPREEQSFAVSDWESLRLKARYQNIDITLTNGEEIVLKRYDYENAPALSVSTENGTLDIRTGEDAIGTVGISTGIPRITLELPRSYEGNVALEASSGSIKVEGTALWKQVELQASSGTLRLESGIECAKLSLHTSSGGIRMGDIDAASLEAHASSGKMQFANIRTEGAVNLQSSSGGVHTGDIAAESLSVGGKSGSQSYGVIQVSGAVDLEASSGSIRADSITAASFRGTGSSGSQTYGKIVATGAVTLKSTSSGITVDSLDCERFDIQSGSGSIHLNNDCAGMGTILSSSGGITVDRFRMRGDTKISASSGSVKVAMASGQGYRLETSVSSGSVHADDIPLNYRDSKGKEGFATVGDGEGGLLNISTTSGSIRIG